MFASKIFDPQSVPASLRQAAADYDEALQAAITLLKVHVPNYANDPMTAVRLAELLLARKASAADDRP